MNKLEKCLVSEAMDKCKCEMCVIGREARDFSIKWTIEQKVREIIMECLKEEQKNEKHN